MMTLTQVQVGGARAKAWLGGEGEPLVLVHGGWGGAAMHWSPVWERLATRFRVVAPELPGIGDRAVRGLRSFDAYAQWLLGLVEALGLPRVWLVGNSFGATISWQLASRLGPRCRGVVLVNGPPGFETPWLLRGLGAIAPVRRTMRGIYQSKGFGRAALPLAFADPALAPAELVHVLADPPPDHVDVCFEVLMSSRSRAPRPDAPVLLVWGAEDRLPGTRLADARRFERSIPDARLVVIHGAGHCPQVERPEEFVRALAELVAPAAPSLARADARP
jgi:2-hydroxy-6-oxonona-2,4-dienedioate hydrolase